MTNYKQIPPLKNFDSFQFPIKNNRYEIAPGLQKIESNEIFVKNEFYHQYLEEKKKCQQEDPAKYYCEAPGFEQEIEIVSSFLGPSSFHENCMALQEDIAIIKSGYNIAIHLSFPNHWNPTTKIGQSFFETHKPVADFEPINKATPSILKACVTKGPFERYAWGLSSDTRLNHHPLPPAGLTFEQWNGRRYQKDMYMRVERQAIVGFEKIDSFLFTIFTFFVHLQDLTEKQYHALELAIDSMTEETLYYKGIDREKFHQYKKDFL